MQLPTEFTTVIRFARTEDLSNMQKQLVRALEHNDPNGLNAEKLKLVNAELARRS